MLYIEKPFKNNLLFANFSDTFETLFLYSCRKMRISSQKNDFLIE